MQSIMMIHNILPTLTGQGVDSQTKNTLIIVK